MQRLHHQIYLSIYDYTCVFIPIYTNKSHYNQASQDKIYLLLPWPHNHLRELWLEEFLMAWLATRRTPLTASRSFYDAHHLLLGLSDMSLIYECDHKLFISLKTSFKSNFSFNCIFFLFFVFKEYRFVSSVCFLFSGQNIYCFLPK